MFNKIHKNPGHVVNFICLVVKCYIYKQRCIGKLPIINEIKNLIVFQEQIEKYNASVKNNLLKHMKKWTRYK